MTEEKSRYSCVMAKFQTNLFVNWAKKNIDPKHLQEKEGYAAGGLEDDSHVTILYGLHTDDYKDLEPILKKQKQFEISFGKIGKFTGPDYDVLKIEVEGKELRSLNKKLRNNFEYTTDYPDYNPHCTLAYVKKNSCDNFLNSEVFSKHIINIKELVFSSSKKEKHDFILDKE